MEVTKEMVGALVRKRYRNRKRPAEWANPIIKINAQDHYIDTICLTGAQVGRLMQHLCYAALCGAVSDIMAFPFVEGVKRGPLGLNRPRIPALLRTAVLERDGGRCKHCGSDDEPEMDHIQPFSLGGKTVFSNLQVLCGPCNRKKGPKCNLRVAG